MAEPAANQLWQLSVAEASRLLAAREINSVDLTQSFLDRIEEVDDRLSAFITVTPDLALKQARDADQRIASGDATSPDRHTHANQGFAVYRWEPPPHARPRCWPGMSRCMTRRRWLDCADKARYCWARETWTSSGWVRRRKIRHSSRRGTRGTRTMCRVAAVEARRRRWRRARPRTPWGPIREAASGSRRRSVGLRD